MNLIRNIRQCNDIMRSKFPLINNGGCGIAAVTIHNILKECKEFSDVKIVAVFDFKCSDDAKRKNLNKIDIDEFMHSYAWDHFMVAFIYKGKRYYVDALNIFTVEDMKWHEFHVHYGSISVSQLSRYNNLRTVNWNMTWTRLNKNRQARETLRKHLKVVK
jgi:hypothetical protein